MKQFMTAETGNVDTNREKFSVEYIQNGKLTFFVWGTFGGATVVIDISPDDGTTWFVTTVSLSAAGFGSIDLGAGVYIARANVTGGTAASLNASVTGSFISS